MPSSSQSPWSLTSGVIILVFSNMKARVKAGVWMQWKPTYVRPPWGRKYGGEKAMAKLKIIGTHER